MKDHHHAPQTFRTKTTIKFHLCDAAGVMFFGNIFSLAHEAFEEFVMATGYQWEEWFGAKDYIAPIRHSEADYRAPFLPGHTYEISVSLDAIGETSFKVKYEFSEHGNIHAVVRMVHVVADASNWQKMKLPPQMKTRLQPYLVQ
ncbi:MAG: acyl-CoA thioesterase [Bdellovibrionales bacterium]|jgi:acyl-CoA thioesterase FadM|nr:acyl-CoA thioesterase [Bdellovibrionales bacterium]